MSLRCETASQMGQKTMTTSSRRFSNRLAGQVGESLVVAELGRRGVVATSFAGNVPDIDVLAFRDGKTVAVQVKAWKTGSIHFDAAQWLEIEFEGSRQNIIKRRFLRDPNLIYVFVRIAEVTGGDEFFVTDAQTLQALVETNHSAFLARHGGVRPRNPASTHTAIHQRDIEAYRDNWSLISDCI